jgi:hypothetical protein
VVPLKVITPVLESIATFGSPVNEVITYFIAPQNSVVLDADVYFPPVTVKVVGLLPVSCVSLKTGTSSELTLHGFILTGMLKLIDCVF